MRDKLTKRDHKRPTRSIHKIMKKKEEKTCASKTTIAYRIFATGGHGEIRHLAHTERSVARLEDRLHAWLYISRVPAGMYIINELTTVDSEPSASHATKLKLNDACPWVSISR